MAKKKIRRLLGITDSRLAREGTRDYFSVDTKKLGPFLAIFIERSNRSRNTFATLSGKV